MIEITSENVEKVIRDLKTDLKIELMSDQDQIFDRLLELATEALDNDEDTERATEELKDLKRGMSRIQDIANDY